MTDVTQKDVTIIDPSTVLVLKDKNASEVAAEMIASGQQNESFYMFDFDTAAHFIQKFKTKLPRVQMFYAMKSNDHDLMVKLAIALGLGFDCASPGEIYKIRKYNVHPTSIIYAAPMKTPEQMQYARESGVRHTTFDSPCELNRLKQYWPDARLLIRLKLDSDSVYKLGDKFGCDFDEAVALLDEAAKLDMAVVGVAFHVGSACFSINSYLDGLRLSRALFDHEASNGRKMNILDIGGGFIDDNDLFDQLAELINYGLEKWFPAPEVQVIAEPGRYICEPAFTLYTNIREVRTVHRPDEQLSMVYINNGIFGALSSMEKWHIINKLKRADNNNIKNEKVQETIIWGPTPDDKDILTTIKMPECLVEDWLVFHQQGAYGKVLETNFCRMNQTTIRSVVSVELWNKIKGNPVFALNDSLLDTDVVACLPSALPPLLIDDGNYARTCDSTVIE